MELKYEAFGLPADGLTTVEEMETYRLHDRLREGYSVVGVAAASMGGEETKLLAVMRMTTDQAMAKALSERNAAVKKEEEARAKQQDLERQLKDAMAQIARLMYPISNGDSSPDSDAS